MLCLDESSPMIMALSLAGAVLLIVGGSLWGSGDSLGNRSQTAAGIGLFCGSLVLLMLAGIGCWCNKCFCTPERKSRLAERFYKRGDNAGGGNKRPSTEDAEDSAGTADCGSLGSSFRSLRSSRRSIRASVRRDRVQPAADGAANVATVVTSPNGAATAVPIPEQSEELDRTVVPNAVVGIPLPQTSIDEVSDVESTGARGGHREDVADQTPAVDDGSSADGGQNSTTIVRC